MKTDAMGIRCRSFVSTDAKLADEPIGRGRAALVVDISRYEKRRASPSRTEAGFSGTAVVDRYLETSQRIQILL